MVPRHEGGHRIGPVLRTHGVCHGADLPAGDELCLVGGAGHTRAASGPGGRGGMDPDAQLASLTTALTLSADQQAKIKPILEADAAKITALRTAQDPDMRTKMTAIRTEQHAAIKALLTADQATKYDAMPQGGGRGGGGGGGAAGGPPPSAPPNN